MLPLYLSEMETEHEKLKMTDAYETYKPVCLKMALSLLSNHSLAEDAVHEAFLSVIRNKKTVLQMEQDRLLSYLIITVKSKCIDIMRKQAKAPEIVTFGEDGRNLDFISGSDSVEDTIENAVMTELEYNRLRKKMSKLDDFSRLMLEMRYVLDMSYAEIAEELDITQAYVNTGINRAKQRVRKMYERRGGNGKSTN